MMMEECQTANEYWNVQLMYTARVSLLPYAAIHPLSLLGDDNRPCLLTLSAFTQ
jgi:hypothetical protein